MPISNDIPEDVLQFIARRIDSVPHLESLLLLWQHPEEGWTDDVVAARIYVSKERASYILLDLARHGLIEAAASHGKYRYAKGWDEAQIMPKIAEVYRRHLVYVASLIHTKSASDAVKEFAKAFQLKKD